MMLPSMRTHHALPYLVLFLMLMSRGHVGEAVTIPLEIGRAHV